MKVQLKINNTSNRQSRNQKRRFSRWMWGSVTIVIILIAAVWGCSQMGGGGTRNGRTDTTKSSVSRNVAKSKPNENKPVKTDSSVQSTQTSSSEKMALALVTVEVGMSSNGGEALALPIDDNGTYTLEETLVTIQIYSEQQGNVLIVNGGRKLGMRTLSLQGKNYVDSKTPASQLSPAGSVQVAFKLDNDGKVIAAQQNTLNMRVGQTIVFVPADARTKEEFDQGNIEIYTD